MRLVRTTAVTGALAGLLLAGGTVPAQAAPAPPKPKPTTTPAPPLPDPLPGRAPDGSVVGGDRLGARGLVLPPGAPKLPKDLTAKAWLVADLDTGEVLAARDPHAQYQPASCQKILTALTLLPRLTDRKRVVRGTDDDVRIEGTRVGIVTNGKYTVDFLFQTLLMVSGNDSANALARAYGGIPRTVAAMNAQAEQLQAYDTHAATPSGLDGPGQLTSAYDLALITRAAMRRTDFQRYVVKLKGRVPAQGKKWKSFEIANHNRLLYNYPGAIGVKNGFTDLARHTYVGAAQRGGRRLVVTFLRAEQTPVQVWTQAARLLDWGFRLRGSAPVGTLVGAADPAATPSPTPSPTPARAAPVAGSAPEGRFPLMPVAGGLAGAALLLGSGGALLERRRRTRR